MPTSNQSPSYRAEREAVRRWLLTTPDGAIARKILMRDAPRGDAASILDDDRHVDWEEVVRDFSGATVLAASCAEAREAFNLAKQSRSTLGPPGVAKGQWLATFSPPLGYVLRRQIDSGDPDYWNNQINLRREQLANPQWCRVPADYVRARLEELLPRGTRVTTHKPEPDPVPATVIT